MSSWWWFWWVCWWNSNDVIVILEVIEMLLISMLLNNCIAKWMNMNVWIFYYRVIMGHCKTGILPKCLPIENKVSTNLSHTHSISLSLPPPQLPHPPNWGGLTTQSMTTWPATGGHSFTVMLFWYWAYTSGARFTTWWLIPRHFVRNYIQHFM